MTAPSSGPKSIPNPNAASIQPMYFSLSSAPKLLKIAILAVAFAPAPSPPKNYEIKLILKKVSSSSTLSRYPNPAVYIIIKSVATIITICLTLPKLCIHLPTKKELTIYATAIVPKTKPT